MLFYKFTPLPQTSVPSTPQIKEVMAYRRRSYSTVRRKLRLGLYEVYLDGDERMIIFASVKADERDRSPKVHQLILEESGRQAQASRPHETVAPLASRPVE